MNHRVVQAHLVDPPDGNTSLHARFYARFRQDSMCRPFTTALDIAERLQ
jgi:hypothetical protein